MMTAISFAAHMIKLWLDSFFVPRKAPKLSADPASLNDSPHSTSENFGEATPIRPTDQLGIIRDTFLLLLGINCFVQQMVRMIIMMVVLIAMKMMMVLAKLWCWCADEGR